MTSVLKVSEIQDPTNGNTALTIDTSGRVLMPQRPMFQVHTSSNAYSTDDGTIPFNTVEIDIGSNFNSSTYKFTAPIAGYYHMHAHVYANVISGTDISVRYQVNGSDYNGVNIGSSIYSYGYNNAGGGSHESIDVPLIMKLSANDAVNVAVQTSGSGQYYKGSRETWWFGYLIGSY